MYYTPETFRASNLPQHKYILSRYFVKVESIFYFQSVLKFTWVQDAYSFQFKLMLYTAD